MSLKRSFLAKTKLDIVWKAVDEEEIENAQNIEDWKAESSKMNAQA